MYVFSNAQPDVEKRQSQRESARLARKDLASAIAFTVITFAVWILGMKAVEEGFFGNLEFIEGETLVWGLTIFSSLLAVVSWDIYRMSRKALTRV